MVVACRIILLAAALPLLAGCPPEPVNNTTLTGDDFTYIVNETASKLQNSDFLAGRDKTSPPITITLEKVLNLTSDIIPEPRQWMFVMKIEGAMPLQVLANQKNLHFQVNPERLEKLRAAGFDGAAANFVPTTHVLSATFRSATRTQDNAQGYVDRRMDRYQLEYEITELKTGAMVWHNAVEFKREAMGQAID